MAHDGRCSGSTIETAGSLTVGSREPDAFPPASVAMIERIGRQVAIAVANALAFREIAQLSERLAGERL